MNNGGKSYRWRQLMQYLEVICDGLLWLSPLLIALDAVIAPISDSMPLDSALWPLAGGVLVGFLRWQKPNAARHDDFRISQPRNRKRSSGLLSSAVLRS